MEDHTACREDDRQDRALDFPTQGCRAGGDLGVLPALFCNCSDGETEAQSSVLAQATGEKAEFGAVRKAKCPAANRTTQPEQILGTHRAWARGPRHSAPPTPTRLRGWLGSPTSHFSPPPPATPHPRRLVPIHSLCSLPPEATYRGAGRQRSGWRWEAGERKGSAPPRHIASVFSA